MHFPIKPTPEGMQWDPHSLTVLAPVNGGALKLPRAMSDQQLNTTCQCQVYIRLLGV